MSRMGWIVVGAIGGLFLATIVLCVGAVAYLAISPTLATSPKDVAPFVIENSEEGGGSGGPLDTTAAKPKPKGKSRK
jgi:hypothetical protein